MGLASLVQSDFKGREKQCCNAALNITVQGCNAALLFGIHYCLFSATVDDC